MTVITESEYWTEQVAAHYLGLAAITLKVWRRKGKAVATAYKFGKRVMYRAADIKTYAEGRRQGAQP
jgi:predicted site-specific integrase-resolvase